MGWQPRRNCDLCLHYGICTKSQKNNHKPCDNFKEVMPAPPRPKKAEQMQAEASRGFDEACERLRTAGEELARSLSDSICKVLNGIPLEQQEEEKPKIDNCEGCIYRGEYQDMGATTPICKKGSSLMEAVFMRRDPNPCKLKITWSEIDKYAKRREAENGGDKR